MISFVFVVCDKSSTYETGSSSTFTGVLFESVCLAIEIERRPGYIVEFFPETAFHI